MQAFLVVPLAVIIPFIAIYLLKAVTGDALSAVILMSVLFVTVTAWFSGLSASSRRSAGRR